ncbi:efflux RND transporter permease subunit [Desulfosporosinus sp. OT]|uniref:efflux RND transporter permease subunit n=1 Tax=Desulfosporosinus sp. OT TaxID=913865 RepID=UPI0002DDB936|nr:efflux RND transporter permease subunit [Desulfosporosinus sp. OT]
MNAILLVDYVRQRRSEGVEINKALVEAGLVRLRPIVMTSLAMIFGMLPSAFTKATGSEMYAPMAHAVIGGLITSTILTLFVVPVRCQMPPEIVGRTSRSEYFDA